jgi:hypothetical protein
LARSADPDAEPVSGLWTYGAGALLALDGLSTLLYGGLLREPLFDTKIDLPFGRMALIWIVLAAILFAAAIGVVGRKTWGRYLGLATQFVSIGVGLMIASSLGLFLLGLVIPAVIVFALWRRWPEPEVVP